MVPAEMATPSSLHETMPAANQELSLSSKSRQGTDEGNAKSTRYSRSRGGRVAQAGRRQGREKGRAEWSREAAVDKRARNDEKQQEYKRRKLDGEEKSLPVYATRFTQEEIAAQERKPKRKVAVMIGYSGSGYKGMQLNHNEKTIEGDLFTAFVAAGAISKANADDPKKSSLVRCARTDKGVHAAGNVISLKLVIEDPDIVSKINERLCPQIRVWGIERTNGSFSSYQFCDSRIYEYLIPTHCFLPPHPNSFLGQQMIELANEAEDTQGYDNRQKDVLEYWTEMEDRYIKPVIEGIDPAIRHEVLEIFYSNNKFSKQDTNQSANECSSMNHTGLSVPEEQASPSKPVLGDVLEIDPAPMSSILGVVEKPDQSDVGEEAVGNICLPKESNRVEAALRLLKAAYIGAKKAYRIHPDRMARIRSALSRFIGSYRYHNYTIDKSYKDPSAIRTIKSFVLDEKLIVIKDTEWVSLKVHGQSFMMHQIRKMVSMVALLVRCGCHEGRMQDTLNSDRLSIPKAPSLGLLLERPVFDEYNKKLEDFGHKSIDFGRYKEAIAEFKQREIYERIFREEERDNTFHAFFAGLDATRSAQLLFLSSVGIEAIKRNITEETSQAIGVATNVDEVSSDDEDRPGGVVDS